MESPPADIPETNNSESETAPDRADSDLVQSQQQPVDDTTANLLRQFSAQQPISPITSVSDDRDHQLQEQDVDATIYPQFQQAFESIGGVYNASQNLHRAFNGYPYSPRGNEDNLAGQQSPINGSNHFE